jgi:large subunit ribosomal protein L21
MKYAVVESGGKQYVAREGQFVEVDLLPAEVGSTVTLDSVLLAVDGQAVAVGKPAVEGAKVTARVQGHILGPKIVVYRYIPKERFRRKKGHRQQYTRLAIEQVSFPGMASGQADEPQGAVAKPARRKTGSAAAKPAAARKRGEAADKAAKPATKGRKKASA